MHLITITSTLLVILNINSIQGMNKMPPPDIKMYPTFGRECPNGNSDCQFKPKESSGDSKIYFSCKNSTNAISHYCFCGTDPNLPKDELMWPLEWNGQSETCLISKGGLCGEDKGLQVTCRSGLDCIEGRCRNANDIQSVTLNKFCNDDLDCQHGLVCMDSIVPTAVKTKRCYSP